MSVRRSLIRIIVLPVGLSMGLCLATFHASFAESLSMPAPPASSVTLPGRGMTMEQVEAEFGVPLVKHDTVGKPPITQWEYSGFSVYFESRWVIHAVGKRTLPQQETKRTIPTPQVEAQPTTSNPAPPADEPAVAAEPEQQGDITIPTEPLEGPSLNQHFPAPNN